VGAIKEKLIGALRAGVKTVLLPTQNRKDVKDLPQEVKDGLEIIHVRYVIFFFRCRATHHLPQGAAAPCPGRLSLTCAPSSHLWEAIRHVWPDAHFPGEQQFAEIQSRL